MSTASITSTSLGKSFKFVAVLCSVVVFVSLSALVVHAAPLAPGMTIPAPAEPDPTGGAPVAGGLPVPFASANYTGTLTSTVIAGDPSNPLGGLTFTYLLSNDASSLNSLERMTISSFAGFATDVSYQVPAAGVPPTFIDRNPIPADVVGFSFFSASDWFWRDSARDQQRTVGHPDRCADISAQLCPHPGRHTVTRG